MKEFEVLMVSPPDKENFVAEIWFDNELVAEINKERVVLEVELFPRANGSSFKFGLTDLLEKLNLAKSKLEG